MRREKNPPALGPPSLRVALADLTDIGGAADEGADGEAIFFWLRRRLYIGIADVAFVVRRPEGCTVAGPTTMSAYGHTVW